MQHARSTTSAMIQLPTTFLPPSCHLHTQHARSTIEDITPAQLQSTFHSNLLSQLYLSRAAVPHMRSGSAIINTASVTAYKGKVRPMQ